MTTGNKILFVHDWNGYLLDDFQVAYTAMSKILAANDRPAIDEETYRNQFTMPLSMIYKGFGFEIDPPADKGQDIYIKTVVEMTPAMSIREGAENFLLKSFGEGIDNIIVSNSKSTSIKPKLLENRLDLFFDDIVGADHPKYGGNKTKIENFSKYLAEHPADTIVFFGDTMEEIEMAEQFGGIAISNSWGYVSQERLEQRNPGLVVDNFKQASELLRMRGIFKQQMVV